MDAVAQSRDAEATRDEAGKSDLVSRLRSRDPEALRETYDAHRVRLHTFLLRLTRDEQLAYDLGQETWLRLASWAPRLAPDSDIGAWLFRVARNLFLSQRRWVLLDRERLATWGWSKRMHEPATPVLEAARHELGLHVERAIASLPLPYREAILLVTVEGFDYAQAAAMLDEDVVTLRKRVERARVMIRQRLDREDA